MAAQPPAGTSPTEEAASAPTPIPETGEQGLTGQQSVDEYRLFDDFSSEALGWPVYDGGRTILRYENQSYSLQVTQPNFYDWAFIPADFFVYEVWFDVQGASGEQDGTFGVMCQYQDEGNYYFVEFDLGTSEYRIGHVQDDYESTLTEPEWTFSPDLYSATSVNRIGVGCTLGSITLFINDQWANEVSIAAPFENPGEAAFFVYAFDTADSDGYKVIIDNVEAWQPVQ
ncbi:MAG: hypothetical protein HYZ26_13020 [Chloroflexi bacterium]|nr:hypothetical protein [Chloroflexota bacterium]